MTLLVLQILSGVSRGHALATEFPLNCVAVGGGGPEAVKQVGQIGRLR